MASEVVISEEERKELYESFQKHISEIEQEWAVRYGNVSPQPPKIVYCMNFYEERIGQVKECIKRVRPYVDRCVLVYDGSMSEESKKWLEEEGCELHYRKWDNHFSKQRNAYLDHVNEGEWVLVSDPDELHSESLFKDLRNILTEAEMKGANILGINAHDITIELDGTVTKTVSDWFKQLLFKFEEGVRYVGVVHETLLPGVHGWRPANLDKRYYYEHIKSMVEIKERGARNVFCGGGGNNVKDKNPMYVELHQIAEEFGLTDWPSLRAFIRNPKLDTLLWDKLKQVIVKHRNDSGWDWENESRDFFLWLSAIHPFEMTEASLYIDEKIDSCGIRDCPLEIFKRNVNTLDDTTMKKLSQIWSFVSDISKVQEIGENAILIRSKNITEDIENFIRKNLETMNVNITKSIQKLEEENISDERLKCLRELAPCVNAVGLRITESLKPTIKILEETSQGTWESQESLKRKFDLEKCKSCVLTAIKLFIMNTPMKSTPQPPSKGSPPEVMAYVEEQYLKILGRNADDMGKQHYTDSILRAEIKREDLPKILMNSEEYKQKHGL